MLIIYSLHTFTYYLRSLLKMSILGEEFNVINIGKKYVKLTSENCCHNGVIFEEGLIVDPIPFSTIMDCSRGGIYCCPLEKFSHWVNYKKDVMCFCWDVTIPNDALVYEESLDKIKCSKIILSNKRRIQDMPELNETEHQVHITIHGLAGYIKHFTDEAQVGIVKHYPSFISLFENSCKDAQMEAVNIDCRNVLLIKNPCVEALKFVYSINPILLDSIQLSDSTRLLLSQ